MNKKNVIFWIILLVAVSGCARYDYSGWQNNGSVINTTFDVNIGGTLNASFLAGNGSGIFGINLTCINCTINNTFFTDNFVNNFSSVWNSSGILIYVNDSNARVGIGEGNPQQKLVVKGTVNITEGLNVTGGIRVSGLVDCNTIDTDDEGNFFCGNDGGGGGVGTDNKWGIHEVWIINRTGFDQLTLNETTLNNTIDSRIVNANITVLPERIIVDGTNLTKDHGMVDRHFILNNTKLSSEESIVVDNFHLIESVDYNVQHLSSKTNISFLNPIFNGSDIMIDYHVSSTVSINLISEQHTGSDATGSDGEISRVLTLANTRLSRNEFIIIDNFVLIEGIDYSVTRQVAASQITFSNPIFDTQDIVVRFYQ